MSQPFLRNLHGFCENLLRVKRWGGQLREVPDNCCVMAAATTEWDRVGSEKLLDRAAGRKSRHSVAVLCHSMGGLSSLEGTANTFVSIFPALQAL
jgi:hypothetical protein